MKKFIAHYWYRSTGFMNIRFFLIFILMYGIFQFFIAIASPGGMLHIAFVEHYFNLVQYYTNFLVSNIIFLLKFVGISAFPEGASSIRTASSGGVHIGYDCLGLGVISVWIAFVGAHKIKMHLKVIYMLLGLIILYLLNVTRIFLLALSIEYHWVKWKQIGIDHHTLYNIVSYVCIFFMAWLFIKKVINSKKHASKVNDQVNTNLFI